MPSEKVEHLAAVVVESQVEISRLNTELEQAERDIRNDHLKMMAKLTAAHNELERYREALERIAGHPRWSETVGIARQALEEQSDE